MTEKELNAEKERMIKNGCSKWKGTAIEKQKCWELGCIDMINSLLAYYYRASYFSAETIMRKEEDRPYSYLADYVKALGRKRVVELIQRQLNDIKAVETNVCTDGEGTTYNSIVWRKLRDKKE